VIDIVKVPPAHRLEHLPGGWGVLADDLWGSLVAAGLLHLLAWAVPHWF
jgi:phosphatidylglycerophosphatase A